MLSLSFAVNGKLGRFFDMIYSVFGYGGRVELREKASHDAFSNFSYGLWHFIGRRGKRTLKTLFGTKHIRHSYVNL